MLLLLFCLDKLGLLSVVGSSSFMVILGALLYTFFKLPEHASSAERSLTTSATGSILTLGTVASCFSVHPELTYVYATSGQKDNFHKVLWACFGLGLVFYLTVGCGVYYLFGSHTADSFT